MQEMFLIVTNLIYPRALFFLTILSSGNRIMHTQKSANYV